MAVLLVGSTGSGKSTLGNFLIDPEGSRPGGPAFAVGEDNLPHTQHTEVAKMTVEGEGDPSERTLTIMDTPGLNESKEADLRHMADLVEYLCKEKTIKACIFVVKFRSIIDQQYKDTIQYYSRLLSFLFSHNVFVVMTAYSTDERSKAMRSTQEIVFEVNVENVKAEIVESAHMSHTPKLFAVDCEPYEENEKMHSLEVRKAILSCIFSQEAVKVEDLKVEKTKAIKEEDIGKVKELEGKLKGYESRLQEIETSAAAALNETRAKDRVVSNINSTLYSYRQRLSELDSDEAVAIKYSGGQMGFFGGIKISMTRYVKKKDIHESDISQLRSQITQQESYLCIATRDAQNCRERYTKDQDKVKPLENLINETKRDISELSSDVMTLEQVRCRFLN
jgi:GTPase Era involved in 16S rRNA processing